VYGVGRKGGRLGRASQKGRVIFTKQPKRERLGHGKAFLVSEKKWPLAILTHRRRAELCWKKGMKSAGKDFFRKSPRHRTSYSLCLEKGREEGGGRLRFNESGKEKKL